MTSDSLVIRADANVEIGTGHIMRCLALAQAWKSAGRKCTFASAQCPPALQRAIRDEGFEYLPMYSETGSEEDAQELCALAGKQKSTWVVVDGYQFGSEYQNSIKKADLDLLFIDDNGHAGRYSADLVLNQNVHASADQYEDRERYTQLLLGPAFAMLRREFDEWKGWKREIPGTARNVLITMGGSDPENLTERVMRALYQVGVNGLSVVVAVGASNPNRETLERAALDSKIEMDVEENCRMPELMAWADCAISAAGSTCWEMCLLGLPAVIIPVAENQMISASKLDQLGAFKSLSFCDSSGTRLAEQMTQLLNSFEVRLRMSQIARSLVDGNGASRVVSAMMKPVAQMVH